MYKISHIYDNKSLLHCPIKFLGHNNYYNKTGSILKISDT